MMHGASVHKSPPNVHDYKADVRFSLQLNRWLMQPMGIWPKSIGHSSIERYAYSLVNIVCTSLILFLIIPCAMYIVLESDDAYYSLKLIGSTSFCLIAVIKYFLLICHENNIRRSIEHIESDWFNTRYDDDRSIMIKSAKFGRRLVIICGFFMYGSGVFYYFALPFYLGTITDENDNVTYRPLIYPVARVIIDARYSPTNEIIYSVQCLSGFVAHSIATSACSLAAVFAMHAYSRMEILMQWIDHLVDGREDLYKSVDERLNMIVQQHVRILRFISLTDKIIRDISIVEILGSTIGICLLGYYVIMEWGHKDYVGYTTYFCLLISITFNIFIFCYIGELVAEQCKKIGEVSHMIEWYRLEGKKALALILIMTMSNSSVKLTAGNVFELSISTFGSVVKTALGYINMLRTLLVA